MRKRPARVALTTVLVASIAVTVALGLAACGSLSSATSSPLASGLMMNTLDDSNGAFSIRYPADYIKLQPSPDHSKDPGLVDQVFLANPKGARQAGSALDVLSITVRRLSKPSKPGDLKKHRSEFEAIATELIGKPSGLTLVTPFALAKLGGLPALRVDYIFKVSGTDMASVAYLVPDGDRVYWVAAQASKGTWGTSGSEMAVSLATFSVSR